MSGAWHLSRVALRPDASIKAVAGVLLPADDDARISAGHRLVWSLFAGAPDRKRDFLWREEERGRFLVFSPARPDPASPLFEVETLEFAHWPRAGDRLAFLLRANPTVSVAAPAHGEDGARPRGKRADLIMHALHATPGRRATGAPLERGEGRASLRENLLGWSPADAGGDPRRPVHDWLAAQGRAGGFEVMAMNVDSYRRVRLPREGQGPNHGLVFGQTDLSGELTVIDAAAFAARLKAGFGRAKAFGCGLMLLARAGARG